MVNIVAVEAITGFILAGGKSSRMGTEKAFLSLQGKTLIEHAIAQARAVSTDIFIVGPKKTFSAYGRIVADQFPGCGPLGGIHAALARTSTGLNLMIAVDTPFLAPAFLLYLAEQAAASAAMVTIPRTKEGWQPLCGIYRKGFLPVAEAALKAGSYRLDALFTPENMRVVDLENEEVKKLGFDAAMFDNLNTREDYERVKRDQARTANHS